MPAKVGSIWATSHVARQPVRELSQAKRIMAARCKAYAPMGIALISCTLKRLAPLGRRSAFCKMVSFRSGWQTKEDGRTRKRMNQYVASCEKLQKLLHQQGTRSRVLTFEQARRCRTARIGKSP